MLMLRSKHRQIIADAEDMAALRLENNNGLRKQLAEAQAKIRGMEDEIAAMKQDWMRGRDHRERAEAYNARRRKVK